MDRPIQQLKVSAFRISTERAELRPHCSRPGLGLELKQPDLVPYCIFAQELTGG